MTDQRIIDEYAAAAADVFDGLDHETLGALNVSEGYKLSALFEALGHESTALHILHGVWLGEEEDSRDPLPWANGHGSRLSAEEYERRSDELLHDEGDEAFYFEPRIDWEDADDTRAYWAARQCAECEAYEGPLVPQEDGRTLCQACEVSA